MDYKSPTSSALPIFSSGQLHSSDRIVYTHFTSDTESIKTIAMPTPNSIRSWIPLATGKRNESQQHTLDLEAQRNAQAMDMVHARTTAEMQRDKQRSFFALSFRVLPFVFWTMVLWHLGPQAISTVAEITESISRTNLPVSPPIDVSINPLYTFLHIILKP